MIFHKIKFLNTINYWKSFPIIEFIIEENHKTTQQIENIQSFFKEFYPAYTFSDHENHHFSCFAQSLIYLQNIIGICADFYDLKSCKENKTFILIAYQDAISSEKLIDLLKAIMKCEESAFFKHFLTLQNIQKNYEDNRLGPSTGHIVEAAIQRKIPYLRLNEGSLIQFGHGAKQKKIRATITDTTSTITDNITQDKTLTKKFLLPYGIPMPEGQIVYDLEQAKYVAFDMGFPLVIKPLSGNQGKGVTVNIQNELELEAAFIHAQQYEDSLLIEKHILGNDYRLLVVGDQLVAASQRLPPSIKGDGHLTILQLIEKLNQDPRRKDDHNGFLSKIVIDDILITQLKSNDYHLDTVLPDGFVYFLRQNANLSTGGIAIDVTNQVHPAIATQAIKIAKILQIDICGIDLVCKNITEPLNQNNGAFIEVNLAPGIRMHIAPYEGQPIAVGDAIMKLLFPKDNGRIPIIAITGTNGKTTTCKITSFILEKMGYHVGLTSTSGVYVQNKKLFSGDCSGPYSAETILMHPDVNACVFETARGGILRKGLGFDQADVAVFTNIGVGDHLGLDNIDTVEELCKVKATLLKTVSNGVAVFNADDEVLMDLAQTFTGRKILFSMNEHNVYIQQHIQAQQSVIYYDANHQHIVLKSNVFIQNIPVKNIRITHQGTIKFQIMNLMAAIAGICGIHEQPENLIEILEAMGSSNELSIGRFNILSIEERSLIIDYGHNYNAILELISTLQYFPSQRRLLMITSPGDRQEKTIIAQMKALSDHFDEVIIYQEDDLRNRKDGEIIEIIKTGFKNSSRIKKIHIIKNEKEALLFTLNRLKKNDLGLLLLDNVEEGLKMVQLFFEKQNQTQSLIFENMV